MVLCECRRSRKGRVGLSRFKGNVVDIGFFLVESSSVGLRIVIINECFKINFNYIIINT